MLYQAAKKPFLRMFYCMEPCNALSAKLEVQVKKMPEQVNFTGSGCSTKLENGFETNVEHCILTVETIYKSWLIFW